ncbi:hypothetical protein ABB02_00212 [Clostridiaceae bacterium JG1575]|nr:hypothetical protein ABB02_00212 [Clostridiaceae bacterium JG1575]
MKSTPCHALSFAQEFPKKQTPDLLRSILLYRQSRSNPSHGVVLFADPSHGVVLFALRGRAKTMSASLREPDGKGKRSAKKIFF